VLTAFIAELLYWFVFVIVINPFRWKWALFVLCGIGVALPKNIVMKEDKLRNGLGFNANGREKNMH
jgi:hypothetical protein